MLKNRYNLVSWVLYDFANSPYSTIMTTLVFPVFFMETVAPGRWSLLSWALLYGCSEIATALVSPPLGAMSDFRGTRKPFLVSFTLLAVCGTLLTVFLGPGELFRASAFFLVAQVGFSLANVFYNSMLYQLAGETRRETVSGIGWGAGYIGGMAFMAIMLLFGGVDEPGFQQKSFALTAAWYLVFSLPVFFFVEKAGARRQGSSLKDSYLEVVSTLKKIRGYGNLGNFMLAAFFFNDAVNSAILFGGIFLRKGYGFTPSQLYMSFIAFNLVAAIGAMALGPVADRLSSRRTLFLLAGAWIACVTVLPFASGLHVLVVIASVVGILIGGTQSVLRGYLSKLAPGDAQGEWFGFYSLMGKAASLVGPLLFGFIYGQTQDIKVSALSLVPLFLMGIFFLRRVRPGETL